MKFLVAVKSLDHAVRNLTIGKNYHIHEPIAPVLWLYHE